MSAPTRTQVRGWIAEYVDALNADWQARHADSAEFLREARFVATEGQKYARIVREDQPGRGGSAEAFVDLTTGDVLKPDGWKRPAKGVRYSLANAASRAQLLERCGDPYYLYAR